jgi:uncharacterized protein YbjQ (UPF0145 family)
LGYTSIDVYPCIHRYTNKKYELTDPEKIEVYSLPIANLKKPYVEIADIILKTNDVYELKKEAAKLGADAIFIVDHSAYKVVAIKYISNVKECCINKYVNKSYGITDPKEIEIYYTARPIESYTEIAEITLASKDIRRLKDEGSKLGANAIIIVGPAYIASMEENGWKTVAIRYAR